MQEKPNVKTHLKTDPNTDLNTNDKNLTPNGSDMVAGNQEAVYPQLEDAALKVAVQFFSDELFPYLGMDEKPVAVMPTEMVHLEVKKMYEDFNFLMRDNSWVHIEFESDSITKKDLRRFREYEAVTSSTYGVDVTTVVVCSAKVKHPMSELRVGMNTYRVKIVRLRDTDADVILRNLSEKENSQICKNDLVPLVLTPLMDGDISEKERIRQGFKWLNRKYPKVTEEDLGRMQAVLYALAVKTLNSEDLEEIKEAISMTILGQMLMEDGIKKGKQEVINIVKLYIQGESPETIAKKLQIPLDEVSKILEDSTFI
ncbi:hypothetical protein NXH76_23760 [Blautia schinkii]|nr:hypothetical protein [Blautia schinkii]